MIRQISVATLAAAVVLACTASAQAQFSQGNSANTLFSQYVTQGAGSPSAALYPAPHPAPLLGAHAYYTYQPLMPHEMMYQHSRNYYNYYNTGGYYGGGGALNKTSVRWQAGNNHMGPLPFSTGLSGIGYRFHSRRYCIGGNCGGIGSRGFGHGGLGCASGNCGSVGDYAPVDGGCATGNCASNTEAAEGTVQR